MFPSIYFSAKETTADEENVKDETSKELLGMLKKAKASSSSSSSKSSSKTVSKKEEVAVAPEEASHSNSNVVVNEDSLLSSLRPAKQSVEASPAKSEEKVVELSEPNTVRSILDRAKEVLKTLDYDGSSSQSTGSSSEISKRGGIMRTSTPTDASSRQFVNDTAKAVKQVAALAQTLVKHAEAKALFKNNKNSSKQTTKRDGIPSASSANSNSKQTKRGFVIPDPAQLENTV